jgi:hypothetical protein
VQFNNPEEPDMPTSIPYDPSLVLGNLVDPVTMDRLNQIAALQAPIDAAQDTMNSFITMKRSIDMTIEELQNMGIDTTDVAKKSVDIGTNITQSAIAYATTRIAQELAMQPLRGKAVAVHESIESPIDYNRTMLKQIALSSDSLKMDAQFFNFETNEQDSKDVISSIKGYITGATSLLGADRSFDLGAAAAKQVNQQVEEHDISGTLVLTCTCTHKMATVLAPLIFDVDKAIRVWNAMYPGQQDRIRLDADAMVQIVAEEDALVGPSQKSVSIISGCTYGSSFVGMVHILRKTNTTTSQDDDSQTLSIQAQAKWGTEIMGAAGGFGIDESSAEDLKDLTSRTSMTAHVTILTEGVVPSIVSTTVGDAVKTFANFSPDEMTKQLATLANATETDHTNAETSSQAARTGQSMVSLKGATVTSVLMGLKPIDAQKNKVIDTNSMMTAFEKYVQDLKAGVLSGVPINFWLKPITKYQLAMMWVNKYFPGKFRGYSGDDSAAPKGAAAAATPAASADGSASTDQSASTTDQSASTDQSAAPDASTDGSTPAS